MKGPDNKAIGIRQSKMPIKLVNKFFEINFFYVDIFSIIQKLYYMLY